MTRSIPTESRRARPLARWFTVPSRVPNDCVNALTPRGAIVTALWCGLVAGFLELASELLRRAIVGERAWLGVYQLNRHYLWMVPAASVSFACGLGLGLAIVARLRPRWAYPVSAFWLSLLVVYVPLLTLHMLHPLASLVLAAGVSARVTPWILKRREIVANLIRRSASPLIGLLAVLGVFSFAREAYHERHAQARVPAHAPGAPNVLLIVLDTVRADSVSPYGAKRDTTPILSRLAREGVRFESARATAPWTLPSHASLFTGRWPHELNTGAMKPLGKTYPTLAEYLGTRGYDTAGFVANDRFCTTNYGLDRGFAHYEDSSISFVDVLGCSGLGRLLVPMFDRVRMAGACALPGLVLASGAEPDYVAHRRSAEEINRSFLSWVDRRRRPFFAFLNYFDAHSPYFVPAPVEHPFGLRPERWADYRLLRDWEKIQEANRWSPSRKRALSDRDQHLARDAYDDCLRYLDDQLARLFSSLKRRGLLDNTLVILTADHGEEFGEHGLFFHFISLHRAELDVPLLVSWPGRVPRGVSVARPVSLRDIPATIVDLIGCGEGAPFPGKSLAALWDPASEKDDSGRDPVYSELPELSLEAIRQGTNVYIRAGNGLEQLFDIKDDPGENRNLAAVDAERPVLAELRRRLSEVSGTPAQLARQAVGAPPRR